MGYYTTFTEWNLNLRDDITEDEFKKRFLKDSKKNDELACFEDMHIVKTDSGGRYIEIEEYYRKAYDFENQVASWIAKVVTKGSIIVWSGEEEDDLGMIVFNGDGDYSVKFGRVVYENEYDVFMERYEKSMPDKLIAGIKKWRENYKVIKEI